MQIRFQRTAVFPHGPAPSREPQLLRLIELCGRTAYKSEEKITDDSARAFVLMLKNHGHLSVLEHSNIVFSLSLRPMMTTRCGCQSAADLYGALIRSLRERHAYHRVALVGADADQTVAIAANVRSWIETLSHFRDTAPDFYGVFSAALCQSHPELFGSQRGAAEDPAIRVEVMGEQQQLQLLQADPSLDLPVFVFKFVCDRGITHEVVRHRVFSFTQESTRYVNYKNRGMTLIVPEELSEFYDAGRETFGVENELVDMWLKRAETIFGWYLEDLNRGLRPEIARDILPNLLKSEIFVSGRWSGWKHFIALRDSNHAHPRIRFLAREVRTYFEALGLS